MPTVDLVDETFLVAAPEVVAAVVADPATWRAWWPDLQLAVMTDRGVQGMRWTVRGALVGSSEIWLEPFGDGVVAHYYLRADLARPSWRVRSARGQARWALRESRRRAREMKENLNRLKDSLESGRAPGLPRSPDRGVPPGLGTPPDPAQAPPG